MRAVRAARDRRSHVRTPRGRSPPCSRGGPSSLHGLCAHRTLQSNENQPCFFQPKDSLCFKKCIFATSGKHLTTESAGKAVVRETHSLIPAGGLPRVGGTAPPLPCPTFLSIKPSTSFIHLLQDLRANQAKSKLFFVVATLFFN